MKATILVSFGVFTLTPLFLSSCGKPTHTDAELASMLLSSNPFYEENTGNRPAAATDPKDGGDGGSIPGPGGGGGGDGGTIPHPSSSPTPSASPSATPIPCPNQETEAGFIRVCSQMRSGIKNFIFFEEAKHPLLTVEHVGVDKTNPKKPIKRSIVLESKEMLGMNLLQNPKPVLPLHINLDPLKKMYPKGEWALKTLNAYICEDKAMTGTCSDKTGYNILSIGTVSFRADRVPKRLSFELWSGRNFLLKKNPDYCEKQYSPLVLDLRGNGIKLSGPGKGVHFDLDDTGTEVLTGWVDSPDDVFLVRDINNNRNIDSGAELFGSATKLKSGLRALNGFEALIDLDSNGDSFFNNEDEAWSELLLWEDRNLNADTDPGELISLVRGGVVSIDLNYVTKNDVDAYGNATKQRSTFLKKMGNRVRSQLIIDVWFNTLIPH